MMDICIVWNNTGEKIVSRSYEKKERRDMKLEDMLIVRGFNFLLIYNRL